MRLLLDEMYPAAIAEALRAGGHDAIAVQEDGMLRELSDEALFAVAQEQRRALVSENVKDFMPIHSARQAQGEPHHGLIFTTNRSFPRHHKAFIGALARALERFLAGQEVGAPEPSSAVHWLRPDSG